LRKQGKKEAAANDEEAGIEEVATGGEVNAGKKSDGTEEVVRQQSRVKGDAGDEGIRPQSRGRVEEGIVEKL
jgi:hypothetical protein